MTLTSLLAFVSTAILARPKAPEPDPRDAKIEALKAEVVGLIARNEDLLHRLASERDERIALLGRLTEAERRCVHAELSRDAWATLYSGAQARLWPDRVPAPEQPQQSPAGLQAQAQQAPAPLGMQMAQQIRQLNELREVWGRCTCVPGRADMFRAPRVAPNGPPVRIEGTHADRIIVDDPWPDVPLR